MVDGLGSDCAALLGLTTPTVRVHHEPQTGTDLLDLLNGEPDDDLNERCDGWDR
jgi:hypothetical protein